MRRELSDVGTGSTVVVGVSQQTQFNQSMAAGEPHRASQKIEPKGVSNAKRQVQLVLCNQLSLAKTVLQRLDAPVRWLSLTETQGVRDTSSYLRSRSDATELDRAELFRQRQDDFRKDYLKFISDLNKVNASSKWWSLPPSSKDPNSSNLSWEIADFLLIVDLVREGGETLLVVTDSQRLQAQILSWSQQEGVTAVCSVKRSGHWRELARNYTPGPIFKASLVTLYRWFLSREISKLVQADKPQTVVTSLVYPASFTPESKTGYRDVYFGPLVDYLGDSGINAVVVGIVRGRFKSQLDSMRRLTGPVPVVPIESFLTLGDILASTVQALWAFIVGTKVRGNLSIKGVDVSGLVQGVFMDATRTGDLFVSSWFYRAAIRLAKTNSVDRFLYPHENRPWEKMCLLAMRESAPATPLVGYQHAAINHSHLHLFLGEGEAAVTPLPDALLTTGEFTRDWLEREGQYPAGILKSACALRQQQSQVSDVWNGPSPRPLLIGLASSIDECRKTFALLEIAIDSEDSRSLVLRPNPNLTAPLEIALHEASITDKYLPMLSKSSLSEDMTSAGIVTYASSTVGVEAAAAGIPTIYLDMGKAFDTDPMRGWDKFKWTVADSEDFRNALDQIDGLPTDQFQLLSKQSQEFARSYLTPVTEDGLQVFLEA